MIKLCRTCLNELKPGQKICPICGTKTTKKMKFPLKLVASLLALLLLLVGTTFYLRWSNSAAKTEDGFYTALANRDVSAIQKLTVHEDSSKISTVEAQAIVGLIGSIGEVEVDKLFSPIKTNRLTSSYKMSAKTVSVAPVPSEYELSMPGVTPSKLVPGKYKITVINDKILRSKYEELIDVQKKNKKLDLDSKFKAVDISDTYYFPLQAYNFIEISMNGKSTSLDDIVKNAPVEIFDYKLPSYKIIANWPWGKIESPSRNFVEYISLENLPYLDKKQQKQLKYILQKTLENLSDDIAITEYVTEHFKSFPPTLIKKAKNPVTISKFQVSDITVNKEESVNGIYTSFSNDSNEFNAHFFYDSKNQKWQLNDLSGLNIQHEDSIISSNSSDYFLSRMHDIPLDKLNDGQLKILFKNVYSIKMSFPAVEVDNSTTSKAKNTIAACSKAIYYKNFTIQSIDVLTKDSAKIKSLDTCIDSSKYLATNILTRNGYSDWAFQEIKPRQKLQK